MTKDVGGSTVEQELADIKSTKDAVAPIADAEFIKRIANAQRRMRDNNIDALFLNAGSNLAYFTGVVWGPSERLFGALLPQEGPPSYVVPAFEKAKAAQLIRIDGDIHVWEEDESPYRLVAKIINDCKGSIKRIGVSEDTPFFLYDGLRHAVAPREVVNGAPATSACRQRKSAAELALMQHAKTVTMDIHRRAARILRDGVAASEVARFIDDAHRKAGSDDGSVFCIVAFGEATAYPHGAEGEQHLKNGDVVLIDTGCRFEGYHSDITRTYVFGDPTPRHREIWNIEKQAQQAAFDAALPGAACHEVDAAARGVIERCGLGPGYKTPGLPHRTGHGVGLDLHEAPYLVKGCDQTLETGMCFSNEPMICVYGEFGVRLEDHFYMTEDGPVWFTKPAKSIDEPFD